MLRKGCCEKDAANWPLLNPCRLKNNRKKGKFCTDGCFQGRIQRRMTHRGEMTRPYCCHAIWSTDRPCLITCWSTCMFIFWSTCSSCGGWTKGSCLPSPAYGSDHKLIWKLQISRWLHLPRESLSLRASSSCWFVITISRLSVWYCHLLVLPPYINLLSIQLVLWHWKCATTMSKVYPMPTLQETVVARLCD